MGLRSKARRGLAQPGRFDYFVRSRLNKAALLAARRRYGGLATMVVGGVINRDPYGFYLEGLRRAVPDGLVVVELESHDLIVDLADRGISRDLLLYGTREEKPARIFTQEIQSIATTEDQVVCLDVGANIGYYALLEADAVDDGIVYAIEPVASNAALLRKNVRLNGYTDRVIVDECAIGAAPGTGRLHLSDHSNLHSLSRPDDIESHSSIEVPVEPLDEYVTARGHTPGAVNVVRMDLEGYETKVIQGMSAILAASGPTLIYLEVHNHFLDDEELDQLFQNLREASFEIVAVEYDVITARPFHLTHDVTSWDELHEIDAEAYSLIVKKP